MRAAFVCIIGVEVVVAAFATGPRAARAGSLDLRPRCGAHGWVLGALDTSHIYQGGEVDKPAVAEQGNPDVKWPSKAERSAAGTVESDARYGSTASVVARFVVDTAGCVDSSTFKTVEAGDSSFSLSVRHILSKLRYQPAEEAGKKVRSWVLWKFVFERRAGASAPM